MYIISDEDISTIEFVFLIIKNIYNKLMIKCL